MVAVIIEYLGARSARAIITHRPEIIFGGNADDAFGGNARDLAPKIECFVVCVINRDEQLIFGKAPFAGQQIPGVGDRLILEIVAERKISQHLEKGMMPRGIANIVQIIMLAAGAHAFLAAGCTRHRALLKPGEYVFEWHHPRVGKHQRWVVIRHQRRRGHDLVALRGKVVEKRAADFVRRCHNLAIRRAFGVCQARFEARRYQRSR